MNFNGYYWGAVSGIAYIGPNRVASRYGNGTRWGTLAHICHDGHNQWYCLYRIPGGGWETMELQDMDLETAQATIETILKLTE